MNGLDWMDGLDGWMGDKPFNHEITLIFSSNHVWCRDEAFEITVNGQLLFSRLESKRLPQLDEVLDALAKLTPEVTVAEAQASPS
ncbi:hypothetical protein CBR_g55540 [Chara braunii]|uniref:Uncharacterized protein n=1 Tax=Chara braunii TaxID=69332 RepID=A0A388MDB4_CHABU|nr:hypothetical protein CBR_g55540 [Chara braunii]|eukprot:GBG92459.1 hypothetical protein CBR_g55540 [Chara braunii]